MTRPNREAKPNISWLKADAVNPQPESLVYMHTNG